MTENSSNETDSNENDFNKYWEQALDSWDGSTKNTFNSNNWDLPSSKLKKQINKSINDQLDGSTRGTFNSNDGENHYSLSANEEIEGSSVESDADLLILDEIARGGMGIVLKGYQTNLEREVAVKTTIVNSKIVRDKFIAESKITAFLDHPNIVPVYDLGVNTQEEMVLVMKLVQGNSWKDILAKKTNTLEKNLQILLTVMNAVAFAHNKGIVHNDLKPDNIMIGKFGEIFLMDWGIAVDVRDDGRNVNFPHKSSIGFPLGTPGYMSPELAQGKGNNISYPSDIYLLGSILYEILMGTSPHQGKNFLAILSSVMQFKPLLWENNIPEVLKNICLKAMSLKPQDRYQGIVEFQEEIESYLQHKESIVICEDAYAVLKNYPKKNKENNSQNGNHFYDELVEIILNFQQALKLWSGNSIAEQGRKEAIVQYIKLAIENNDLELAQSQLKKLPVDDSRLNALQQEIINARESLECNNLSQKMMKIAQYFTFVLCFRQILILFMPPTPQPTYFSQNDFKAILLFTMMIVVCLIAWNFFNRKHYNLKKILVFSMAYEFIMVFLVSLVTISIQYHPEAVTTGMYPSVLFILIFRLIIPYPLKTAFIVGLISATIGVLNLFLSEMMFNITYPRMIIEPYIIESYLMAIAGSILASRTKS